MLSIRILFLMLIIALVPHLARAQFFGVTVHHYKGNVVRVDSGYSQQRINLTVLAVYPQPTTQHIQDIYTGIDINPLIPIILKEGYGGLDRISHYFMNVIQNAYYEIAESRGMLKMGSPFQKERRQSSRLDFLYPFTI